MSLSAKEAAELVGISKDGILKAIRTGKISAQKDNNGTYRIEPVELLRVYKPVSTNGHAQEASLQTTPQNIAEESTDSLQSENKGLREIIQRQDDVIADLRARLDAEAEERRKLTLILTEVRNAPPPVPVPVEPAPQPRSWWQRLFGGG